MWIKALLASVLALLVWNAAQDVNGDGWRLDGFAPVPWTVADHVSEVLLIKGIEYEQVGRAWHGMILAPNRF